MEITTLKKCNFCKESKPATQEFFSPKSNSKDGLYTFCHVCSNLKSKQYRDKKFANSPGRVGTKGKGESHVYMRIRPDSRGAGESQARVLGNLTHSPKESEALFPKNTSFIVENVTRKKKGKDAWFEVDLREIHPKFNKND